MKKITVQMLDEMFNITRASDTTEPGRTHNFATFIAKHNLSIQEAVDAVIQQDKTGYKEVVGNITKITGHGLKALKLSNDRFKAFGNIESDPYRIAQFDELVKLKIKEANEHLVRVNFSTELNGVVSNVH